MTRTKKKKESLKTIKIPKQMFYNLVSKTNKLDAIVDNIKEMNDLYISDLSELDQIKFELVRALDLDWNSETYRYEATKGDKV